MGLAHGHRRPECQSAGGKANAFSKVVAAFFLVGIPCAPGAEKPGVPPAGRYDLLAAGLELVKFDTATGRLWVADGGRVWVERVAPSKLAKGEKPVPGRFRLAAMKATAVMENGPRDETRWVFWDSAEGKAWRSGYEYVPDKEDKWFGISDKDGK